LRGADALSGRNHEHRRLWIEEKPLGLLQCFGLKRYACSFMSNHFHVVLFVDAEAANCWSREQIIERWHRLLSGYL
jgi:hypothetical protein